MPRSPRLWMFILLLVAPTTASAQPFVAFELGTLPGMTSSVATDINNRQQVVGYSGDQAFLWEPGTGMRALGVRTTSRLVINNSGVIAGLRMVGARVQPFAWFNGVVSDVPTPPDDYIWAVRALTDNGILLMHGTRSWAVYQGVLYDLAAITGAAILAINEAIVLGGTADGQAYLRYPDGRTVTPWSPSFGGGGSVDVIGPAGHFAGRAGFEGYYGTPDGAVRAMGIASFPRSSFAFHSINRAGAVVGTYSQFVPFLVSSAFVYQHNQVIAVRTAIVSGPVDVDAVYAINDAGSIAGAAGITSVPRAVLLVPTVPAAPSGVSFAVTGSVVAIRWDAPLGAMDYIVEAGSRPGARDLYNAAVGTQPLLVTTAPSGRYYVRVRARNAVGVSAASEELVIDVP